MYCTKEFSLQYKMSKKNNNLSKYARFSGIGLQMGLTIWLGNLGGAWLDKNYPTEGVSYAKIITMVAVVAATYSIIKQVKRLSEDEERTNK